MCLCRRGTYKVSVVELVQPHATRPAHHVCKTVLRATGPRVGVDGLILIHPGFGVRSRVHRVVLPSALSTNGSGNSALLIQLLSQLRGSQLVNRRRVVVGRRRHVRG